MEIYTIPFEDRFIIYRPLRRLAFIGNRALAGYLQGKISGETLPANPKVEAFLKALAFWDPDPEPPAFWEPDGPYRPTMAVLLMTGACNLRCTYCYAEGGDHADLKMSWPLARKIIDTVAGNARLDDLDGFSLAFHGGGEPTLNWSVLTAAVKHAEEQGLKLHISMATNGIWNDRQRRFILEHFHGISLSFDGLKDIQDAQRPLASGRSSFEAVMETVSALDEAEFSYGIRVTTTMSSLSRLPENIDFLCQATRSPIFQVEPWFGVNRGEYADPSEAQAASFAEAFLKAYTVAVNHGRTLFYSGARPMVLASTFCRAAEEALVATPEGDLVACFETHGRSHPLLSQLKIGHATPDEVAVDPQRLRAWVEKRRQQRAECEGCFCYWHCGGDCTSRCLASPRKSRGRCLTNRAITQELLAWQIAEGGGLVFKDWLR